jgi:hypothetical protein
MKTLRNTRTRILLTVTAAALLLPAAAAAQAKKAEQPDRDGNSVYAGMPDGTKDLSVDEVVRWTNYVSYYQGHSGRANVNMDIVDGRGQKRTRKFTILRRDDQPAPNVPVVRVVVALEGGSAKDVEKKLAGPLEEALKGVDGAERIDSSSQEGRCVVRVAGKKDAAPETFLKAVTRVVEQTKDDLPAKAGGLDIRVYRPDHAFTGEQKYYVYFRKPADVAKTVFLVWKHLGENDDRWMHFPNLDLVKRISSADKRTSFVGSHFLYEDVSGRNVALDNHELIDTNKTYFVMKNTPRDPKNVEFSRYVMYIHRKTFLVVQTTYYDKQGKPYRKYTAQAVKTIEGFPTVVKSQMKDLKTGGYTNLSYSDVDYNVGLPEDIFDKRYLRRPPRKHLGD